MTATTLLTVPDISCEHCERTITNALQPVGRYPAGGLQHLVIASQQWASIDDIPQTPLVVKGHAVLRVADIAMGSGAFLVAACR